MAPDPKRTLQRQRALSLHDLDASSLARRFYLPDTYSLKQLPFSPRADGFAVDGMNDIRNFSENDCSAQTKLSTSSNSPPTWHIAKLQPYELRWQQQKTHTGSAAGNTVTESNRRCLTRGDQCWGMTPCSQQWRESSPRSSGKVVGRPRQSTLRRFDD